MAGYLPIGFAFGVLAAAAGLTAGQAAAMSVFVYAGSSQFIAVGLIGAGAGPPALALTVFLVNLRHLLMSASLAPFLGRLTGLQQACFCYEITDESFALHSARFQEGEVTGAAEFFTVNISAHLAWIFSTLAGAWLGRRLAVDTRLLGLDYALPAMFIALLVVQLNGAHRAHRVLIALLAAGLSTVLYLAGAGHWHIIAATLVAATLGAVTEKKDPAKKEAGEI